MGRPSNAALSSSAAASDSATIRSTAARGRPAGRRRTTRPPVRRCPRAGPGRRQPAVGRAHQARAASAADRAVTGQVRERGPLPQQGQAVDRGPAVAPAVEDVRRPVDQVDQRGGPPRPGPSGLPVSSMAPLAAHALPLSSTARSCHRWKGAPATVSGMVAPSAFSRHPTASWPRCVLAFRRRDALGSQRRGRGHHS